MLPSAKSERHCRLRRASDAFFTDFKAVPNLLPPTRRGASHIQCNTTTREMPTSATGIEQVLSVYSPVKYTVCVTTQNAVLHIVHLRHLLVNPQLKIKSQSSFKIKPSRYSCRVALNIIYVMIIIEQHHEERAKTSTNTE